MELSIREHIISNFKDDNEKSIQNAIDDSIKENDEELLPGLGVFMELVWQNADQETKEKISRYIVKGLKENNNNKEK